MNVELRSPELPVPSSPLCTESSLDHQMLACVAFMNLFAWGFGDIVFSFCLDLQVAMP